MPAEIYDLLTILKDLRYEGIKDELLRLVKLWGKEDVLAVLLTLDDPHNS